MIKNYTVSLIIPCYNEESGLKKMLVSVPKLVDNVIVVDNNSSDKTPEIALEFGAQLEKEPIKGYGATMKRGIYSSDCDIIITMDGDNTYPLNSIESITNYLIENKLEFISCNRFPLKNKGSMNAINQLGNQVLTIASKLLFNIPIKDSQSGMWVFKRDVLEKIDLKSNGMPLSQEIKIKSIVAGVAFEEYHIPYFDRVGISKLNRLADGFNNLLQLFLLRFRL